MTFHIITLFPKAFDSYLGESIVKRAIEDNKIAVKFYNPRDFVYPERSRGAGAKNKTGVRIDKRPYGGGPGMVIQAEPVIKAIENAYSGVLKNIRMKKMQAKSYLPAPKRLRQAGKLKASLVWLSPSGKQFDNAYAAKTAKKFTDIIIVCGRYEGIDARVKKAVKDSLDIKIEDVSVGPFVLTGGELPAMIILDAIARQIPGILGNIDSLEERRVASSDVYTRPEVFKYKGKNYHVPKILLSGHRAKIEEWKRRR